MAKSAKKTPRKAPKTSLSHQKRTAKAIASAIAKARKAAGKRGADDADIHVHVGDVVMMGFDEAVDAEEWGARETTNEIGGGKGRAGRNADPQDEKNRRVHRTITLRKGGMKLQAVEKSQPARKKKAAKKAAKKAGRKKARRR